VKTAMKCKLARSLERLRPVKHKPGLTKQHPPLRNKAHPQGHPCHRRGHPLVQSPTTPPPNHPPTRKPHPRPRKPHQPLNLCNLPPRQKWHHPTNLRWKQRIRQPQREAPRTCQPRPALPLPRSPGLRAAERDRARQIPGTFGVLQSTNAFELGRSRAPSSGLPPKPMSMLGRIQFTPLPKACISRRQRCGRFSRIPELSPPHRSRPMSLPMCPLLLIILARPELVILSAWQVLPRHLLEPHPPLASRPLARLIRLTILMIMTLASLGPLGPALPQELPLQVRRYPAGSCLQSINAATSLVALCNTTPF